MKTQQGKKSQPSPEEFARLIGSNPIWSADPILQAMLERGYPMTLETFLELGFDDAKLEDLHPEDRANMPAFLIDGWVEEE